MDPNNECLCCWFLVWEKNGSKNQCFACVVVFGIGKLVPIISVCVAVFGVGMRGDGRGEGQWLRQGRGEVENSVFFGFSAMAGVLWESRGSSEEGRMTTAAGWGEEERGWSNKG